MKKWWLPDYCWKHKTRPVHRLRVEYAFVLLPYVLLTFFLFGLFLPWYAMKAQVCSWGISFAFQSGRLAGICLVLDFSIVLRHYRLCEHIHTGYGVCIWLSRHSAFCSFLFCPGQGFGEPVEKGIYRVRIVPA